MNGLSMYALSAWILAGVSVGFILVGVFARRIVIHSKPHCAGCGYPLTDLPTPKEQIICPECGRSPQNQTEAYTMRKRRWPLALGILLFAGSLVLPQIPTMQSGGWTAALPLSVQIKIWQRGNKQLHDRIHSLYRNKELTDSQTKQLHTQLLKAFNDPNTPEPTLIAATGYFNFTQPTSTSFLTESNFNTALQNGTQQTQSLLLTFAHRYTSPDTPKLRQTRRLRISDPDKSIRTAAIKWLIRAPSDDPEDERLIRSLIKDSDKSTFWYLRSEFDSAADRTLAITADLLKSDSPKTRSRALQCLDDRAKNRRYDLPDQIALSILALINDPNPTIQHNAIRLVEYLPESIIPNLDQRLRTLNDPDILDPLIHEIIRMDPDPAGLTPALAIISRNPELPLTIRLQAADAYTYIRARARVYDQPENLWPAYDALINTLAKDNYEPAFLLGESIRIYTNNWAATALSNKLLSQSIPPDQLSHWFTQHPGIIALLQIWESHNIEPDLSADPVERYHQTLINANKKHKNSVDLITNAATHALQTHFPNDPIPQPDP